MSIRRSVTLPAALLATIALVLGLVSPAFAQPSADLPPGPPPPRGVEVLAVHHGPVTGTLADAGSDGHQLGDQRVTSVATEATDGRALGRLDAILTTTAVDTPSVGDEVRIRSLLFSFDDAEHSQVYVGGSALYRAQGSTLATGDVTTRPILGGSGRYAGASGQAVSQHFDDDTWAHWLELETGKGPMGPKGAGTPGHGPADDPVSRELRERAKDAERAFKDAEKALRDHEKTTRGEPRPGGPGAADDSGLDLGDTLSAQPAGAAIADVGVLRTDLGVAEPGSAPGEQLGLWHYVIPAGTELAPHRHPGWQIARLAAGELEYTIISGEGTLIHADGSSESIGPGTYTFVAGDTVVENPDLHHFGANRTDEDVILLAATLYPDGAPLSIPLDTPASPEPSASPEPAA